MNLRGQLQANEAKVKALEEACAEAEEVGFEPLISQCGTRCLTKGACTISHFIAVLDAIS